MAPDEDVDLWAPFTRDTILEVRSGKMKKLKGLNIESGIDKTLHHGRVHIGKLGIVGDEHDYTFHGGLDKAVHGCKSEWSQYFSSSALPPVFLFIPAPNVLIRTRHGGLHQHMCGYMYPASYGLG